MDQRTNTNDKKRANTIDLAVAFRNTTNKWKEILIRGDMGKYVSRILNKIKDDNFTPIIDDVFTFASYDNYKVVIIGQDPYHQLGHAHGLSFSTLGEQCPRSLSNIFNALVYSGLIDRRPDKYDLTPWLCQGVLMLNTSLTTKLNVANAHQKLWNPYMDNVIQKISETNDKLIFLLWGNFAQGKSKFIDSKKHTIMKYTHPISAKTPSFKHCDHFKYVSKLYPNITWKLDPIGTLYYTDGSCKNNQRRLKARGTWGAVCYQGPHIGKEWGGVLPLKAHVKYNGEDVVVYPSNNRAEMRAIIKVELEIIKAGFYGDNQICSDSQYCINILTEWGPNWDKRKLWEKKKNSDLSKLMYNMYKHINATLGALTIEHVPAWHDYKPDPKSKTYKESKQDWEGNKRAEEIAMAMYE
jgi:uracil-DNA glycosylase